MNDVNPVAKKVLRSLYTYFYSMKQSDEIEKSFHNLILNRHLRKTSENGIKMPFVTGSLGHPFNSTSAEYGHYRGKAEKKLGARKHREDPPL